MEVKPGYKQTEVGVIPEEWEIKPLHTLADKIMVGIASAATHAYRKRGVVMFRNQNIKPGYLDDTDVLYIDEVYEETYRNKRLKAGDLLTARTGYPGTTSIVPAQYEGAQSFTTLITRPYQSLVDSEYLCCFINSEVGQTYFEQNQTGGGQKNVNAGSLKHLAIPLPPTKAEQEAIAEALSDVDALIESLEQLLTKKRWIKEGAMQELLTGKKRLPGFSGKWEATRLGEFVSIRNQKVLPSGIDIDTPCVELDHIGQGDGRLLECSTAQHSTSSKYRFFTGDVLFGRLRSYLRKYWHADRDGICSTEIWPLVVDPVQAEREFLFALVQSDRFIAAASISYGTHMPRADWDVMVNFPVRLPKVEEQAAIATVLSDMNAEITTLEAKLSKARQIKQGMMQELLTGRIRLI